MNNIVLVFGGSGDIGKTIVNLLSINMKVYSTYYKTYSENKLYCDARVEKDVNNVINTILEKEKKIDVVINAITPKLKIKDFTMLDIKEDILTNILGSSNIYKGVLPSMRQRKKGLIITILTELVNKPVANMSSYICSKIGLKGLIDCLKIENKKYNIKFVNIYPSFVETKLLDAFSEEMLNLFRRFTKFQKPEDIAKSVKEITILEGGKDGKM